ncbi:MAG: GNAT family N-acetyltransferase, partial [Pseudomonadota bacterium]
ERNRQCAMKELYVRAKYRGRGIGQKLMKSVAQFAVSNGCHRIDWNVKAANDRGIAYYKSLGATLVDDRLSFRISGKKLELLSLASAPADQ